MHLLVRFRTLGAADDDAVPGATRLPISTGRPCSAPVYRDGRPTMGVRTGGIDHPLPAIGKAGDAYGDTLP